MERLKKFSGCRRIQFLNFTSGSTLIRSGRTFSVLETNVVSDKLKTDIVDSVQEEVKSVEQRFRGVLKRIVVK